MRRMMLAVLLISLALAGAAAATETQWWTSDSPADYAKAESRGVVVGADGVLAPGPAATVSLADSLRAVWALAVLADGSVAIAGDRGRIDQTTDAMMKKIDAYNQARKPGERHPYVVGGDVVARYLTVVGECAQAAVAGLPYQPPDD